MTIKMPHIPTISAINLMLNDLTSEQGLTTFEDLMVPRIAWLNARQEELEEKHRWSPGARKRFEQTMNNYSSIRRRLLDARAKYLEEINPLPRWDEIPELRQFSPYQRAFNIWREKAALIIEEYRQWNSEMKDLIQLIVDRIYRDYAEEETRSGKKGDL